MRTFGEGKFMGLVSEPVLLRERRVKVLEYLSEANLQFSTVLSEIVQHSFRTMDPVCSALFLWACEVGGGDAESAVPLALAIECLHRFVVLHAGLACDRRNGDSAADIWGLAQTLNAGDAFHAVGLRLLAADPAHSERALDAGEMLTRTLLNWTERCSRPSAFEPQARPKGWARTAHGAPEACFYGASLEAGAIMAGSPPHLCAAFRRAGRFLGVAERAAAGVDGTLARKYADKAVAVAERSPLERSHLPDFKEIAYHLASAASE